MVNQAFNAPVEPTPPPIQPEPKSPQSGGNKTLIITLFVVAVVLLLAVGAMAGYLIYKINTSPVDNSGSNDWQSGQTTSTVTSTSTTTPEDAVTVSWNEPQQITPLKLFKETADGMISQPEKEAKYFKVGIINSGKYIKGEIILAGNSATGIGGLGFYRFIRKDGNYILIQKNSSEDPSILDTSKFVTDENYSIEDLNFPKIISGPQPRQILELDTYTNAFFSLNGIKEVFTDPKLGVVYTSDGYDYTNANLFLRNGFYVKAPDGTVRVYSLKIDILKDDSYTPQITWSDGKVNAASYSYTDKTGCGSSNYVSIQPVNMTSLKVTGKTAKGDDIYEFKDAASGSNLLLEEMYNNKYQVLDGQKKISYASFVSSHPMFFWIDPFGRLIKFENSIYGPVAECGKPVIYLYPTKAQNISVKVEPQGGMSYSDPAYGNGWNVYSDTQSNLTELSSGKKYPYLFWEGSGGIYEQPKKGFVIKQSEVHNFLISKLAQLGMNKKESADFMEFWEPRMQGSPYYFVTFLGTAEMNRLAPLTINPKPDTVIRILMDFSPIAKPIKVEGYSIKTPARNGFTVVEWGGVIR